MEQIVIKNKPYTIESQTPVNLIDEEGLIDFTSTLLCRMKIQVVPAEGEDVEKNPLTEDELQHLVTGAVTVAYVRAYENGMPIRALQSGVPDSALLAAIRTQLEDSLDARFGAAVSSFDVEQHWIPAADQQELDHFLQMNELRDPKKAAEALIQAMNAKLQSQQAPAEPEALPIPETLHAENVERPWYAPSSVDQGAFFKINPETDLVEMQVGGNTITFGKDMPGDAELRKMVGEKEEINLQATTVVCPGCGHRVKRTKFCPDCGRPLKNWRCACGRENSTPFCRACGKPAKSGTII